MKLPPPTSLIIFNLICSNCTRVIKIPLKPVLSVNLKDEQHYEYQTPDRDIKCPYCGEWNLISKELYHYSE